MKKTQAELPLLEIKNLRCWLKISTSTIRAVDCISFSIQRGETFALLGESGSGKTMTGLCISQLLPSTAYLSKKTVIQFDGENLLSKNENELKKIRGNRIAHIFQNPMNALNPIIPVEQQIDEILKYKLHIKKNDRQSVLKPLFKELGIMDLLSKLSKYPFQFSGGELQRLMIAMALLTKPDLIIADEPTAALDGINERQIIQILKRYQQEHHCAILLITHDLTIVRQIAQRVGVMYAGHLIETAGVDTFYRMPQHPYSQQLFAALPRRVTLPNRLFSIPGQMPALTKKFGLCRFLSRCCAVTDLCKQVRPEWIHISDKHITRCHLAGNEQTVKALEEAKARLSPIEISSVSVPADKVILQLNQVGIDYSIHSGIFKRVAGCVPVLKNITFSINSGQSLALVGLSGSGKTTLAKSIIKLHDGSVKGEIRLDDQLIATMPNDILRKKIQMLFQDVYSSLNPRLTIEELVSEGILLRAEAPLSTQSLHQQLYELLDDVGLSHDMLTRYPHELSGGQRQRVNIARVLSLKPSLLILDEPTSALDVSVSAQIINLLKTLQVKHRLSYLFITHNIGLVTAVADNIAVLHEGQIVEMGPVESILSAPKQLITRQLCEVFLDGAVYAE